MKTKKEIIDYINKEFYCYPQTDVDILIQMIKDFEPEVKKLEFRPTGINSDEYSAQQFIIYKSRANNLWIAIGQPVGIYYESFKQAKEACQKHYEETILGRIKL